MYIVATFSPFFLQKQNKYGPLSSKINQPSTDYTLITPTINTTSPNINMNSFTFTTDHFINEILQLLKPHVDIDPHTNPLDLLKHIFITYQPLKSFTLDIEQIQELLQKIKVSSFAPPTSN